MEQGSLRADVNVSVRKPGAPLGTRCEIKNVNSIRFIGQAVDVEARRQIGILEDGGSIDQETRLFDPGKGETRAMRSKEEAHDYRYFPDPDLLPLEFTQSYVDDLAAHLPELPDAKKARFMAEYGLPSYDAGVLVADKDTADYYETAVRGDGGKRDAKVVANWVLGDVAAYANASGVTVAQTHISPAQVAGIVDLIADGTISGKIAKDVLQIIISDDKTGMPSAIVEARGLKQVTDTSAIEAAVDAIIAANPDKVAQAQAKPTMLGWFVGQVMKQTGGKANPQAVNTLLKTKLGV
jgi:aspartyl-tRNA(Asn)/glutamyl-tRNA(Gln) amidotransferase subunit B